MGYRVPWRRLTEAERQRRTARGTAKERERAREFRAQLAEIEATNRAREERAANLDLVGGHL